jgi:hypothetical protein
MDFCAFLKRKLVSVGVVLGWVLCVLVLVVFAWESQGVDDDLSLAPCNGYFASRFVVDENRVKRESGVRPELLRSGEQERAL